MSWIYYVRFSECISLNTFQTGAASIGLHKLNDKKYEDNSFCVWKTIENPPPRNALRFFISHLDFLQRALKLASSRLSKPTKTHWNFNVFWLVSKVSNSPTWEPSVKNLDVIWKNEEHFLGGGFRWSFKRKKNYLHISYRSICGGQSRLRQSETYLRIYILKISHNKFNSFIVSKKGTVFEVMLRPETYLKSFYFTLKYHTPTKNHQK